MINLHPWNPRENLTTADGAASYLDTILAYEGHWGGIHALSDIADAMGEERVIPKAWRSEKSVSEAEKRGDVLDFSAFMDMARAGTSTIRGRGENPPYAAIPKRQVARRLG